MLLENKRLKMPTLSLTILIIGIVNNIYASGISPEQLVKSLLQITDNKALPTREIPLLSLNCPSPWVLVGTRCVFVDLSKSTTFDEGRNFCRELHNEADLATFRDANEFHYILQHVKAINSANNLFHFWIGARDKEENNVWTWNDGQPMPMGSPFWGATKNYANEPVAKNGQYCALLYQRNRYFVHDIMCDGWKGNPIVPICQYDPFTH